MLVKRFLYLQKPLFYGYVVFYREKMQIVSVPWTNIHDKILCRKPRYFYRYLTRIYEKKSRNNDTNYAKNEVYSININNVKNAENGLKSEKKPCKCVFGVIRFRSCVRHAMKREIASDGDTPDTVC